MSKSGRGMVVPSKKPSKEAPDFANQQIGDASFAGNNSFVKESDFANQGLPEYKSESVNTDNIPERTRPRFTKEEYEKELAYRQGIPQDLQPYKGEIDQVVQEMRKGGDIDTAMAMSGDLEWTLQAFGYDRKDAELIDKARQNNLDYGLNAVKDAPKFFRDDLERKETVKALKTIKNPYLMRQITSPEMAHVREPVRIKALASIDEKMRELTGKDYNDIESPLGKMANTMVTAPHVFADMLENMPQGAKRELMSDPEFRALIRDKEYARQVATEYQNLQNRQKGFFEKVGGSLSRGYDQVVNNIESMATDIVELLPVRDIAYFEKDGTPVYKDATSMSDAVRQDNLELQLLDAVDPISGDAWYKQGFYGATRMVPMIAGSVAARPASSAFLYSQGYGELKSNLQDSGYSNEQARNIAGVAALPFAALERLQMGTIFGKNAVANLIPKALGTKAGQKLLKNTMLQAGKKLSESAIARRVGSFALDAGSEIVEEDMQEVVKILSEVVAAQSDEAAELGIEAPEWEEIQQRLIDTTVEMVKVAPFINGPAQIGAMVTANNNIDAALEKILKLDEINEEFFNADMGEKNRTAKNGIIRSIFKPAEKARQKAMEGSEEAELRSAEVENIEQVEGDETVYDTGVGNEEMYFQGIPSANIQAKELKEYLENQEDKEGMMNRMGIDGEILEELAAEPGGLINVGGDLFLTEVAGTEKYNELKEIAYWDGIPLSVNKLEEMRRDIVPAMVRNLSENEKRIRNRKKAIKAASKKIKPVLQQRGMKGDAVEANVQLFATMIEDIAFARGESVEEQLDKISVVATGKNISGVMGTGSYKQGMVNKGRLLGENIYSELFSAEDGESVAELAVRKAESIAQALVSDGVIDAKQVGQYYDAESAQLTPAGKELFEYALVGSVVSDAEVIDALPSGYREKIITVSGLVAATGVDENASLLEMMDIASRHIANKEIYSKATGRKKVSWEMFAEHAAAFETGNSQDSMSGPYWELAKWLDGTDSAEIKSGLEKYYNEVTEGGVVPVVAFNDMLGKEVFAQSGEYLTNIEKKLLAAAYTEEEVGKIDFDNIDKSKNIPQRFVKTPGGKLNWGVISHDLVRTLNNNNENVISGEKRVKAIIAPIRLNVGEHYTKDDGKPGGFGLVHLQAGGRSDARSMELIAQVLNDYSKAYMTESGRIFLVKEINNKNKSILVELVLKTNEKNDDYYAVVTQFSPRKNQLKKMKLVWSRRGNPRYWSPTHTQSSLSTGLQADKKSDLLMADTNMDDDAPWSLPQTSTNNIPHDTEDSKNFSGSEMDSLEQGGLYQSSYNKTLNMKVGESNSTYRQGDAVPQEVLDNDIVLLGDIQKKRFRELSKLKKGFLGTLKGLKNKVTRQDIAQEEGISDYDVALVPRDISSEKEAELAKAGVSIIKYDPGSQESKIEAFQKADRVFLANLEKARGQLTFTDTQAIITLFTNADPTTLTHEMAHYWLKVIRDSYEAGMLTEEKVADFEILKEWLGVGEDNILTVEQQETFATGIEKYLFENDAPSKAMRSVFASMRKWLLRVYQTVKNLLKQAGLDIEITPEAKAVYGRMLATQEEIDAAREGLGAVDGFSDILNENDAQEEESAERYREILSMNDHEYEQHKQKLRQKREELRKAREEAEGTAFKITVSEWLKNGGYEELQLKASSNIGKEQIYLAINLIREKQLSQAEAEMYFGAELAGIIEKHGELFNNEGESAEIAAINYGYQNGNDLLEKLRKSPAFADAVAAETERLYHLQLNEMKKAIHEMGVDGTHSEEIAERLVENHNERVEGSTSKNKSNYMTTADMMRDAAKKRVGIMSMRELSLEYARRGEKAAVKKYEKLLRKAKKINKRMGKNIGRNQQKLNDIIEKLPAHKDWIEKETRFKTEKGIERVRKAIEKRIGRTADKAAKKRAESYIKKLEGVSSKVAGNKAVSSLNQIVRTLEKVEEVNNGDFNRIYKTVERELGKLIRKEYNNFEKILGKEAASWGKLEEQNREMTNELARIEEQMFAASNERLLYNYVYLEIKNSLKETRKLSTTFSKSRLVGTLKNVDGGWADPIRWVYQNIVNPQNTTERMKPTENSDTMIMPKGVGLKQEEQGGVYQENDISSVVGSPANYIAEWIINKDLPKDYTGLKDLTVGQALDLQEALSFLVKRGRGDLNALKEAQKENVESFVESFKKNVEPMMTKDLWGNGHPLRRAMDALGKAGAYMKMVEFLFMEADNYQHLDKTKGFGQMMQMFNAFVAADNNCNAMIRETYQNMEGHLTQIGNTMKDMTAGADRFLKFYNSGFFEIPGLPVPERITKYRQDTKWNANKLFAMAFNLGNDANLYSLCVGYDFINGIDNEGRPIYDENKLKTIQQQFSEEDVAAIQGVWDVLDSLFPMLDEAHYRATGQHLVKEKARSFDWHTSDGTVVRVRGGYYPLKYDSLLDMSVAELDEINSSRKDNSLRFVKTSDGQTKARLRTDQGKAAVSKPPKLDVQSVLSQHIYETVRDITHKELVMEADSITKHPVYVEEFRRIFGLDGFKALRNWLGYQANPLRVANTTFDTVVNHFRNSNSLSVLGLNLIGGVKQRTSIFNGISKMNNTGSDGYKYFLKGVQAIGMTTSGLGVGLKGNQVVQEIFKLSSVMRERNDIYGFDIYEQKMKLKPLTKYIEWNGEKVTWSDFKSGLMAWVRMNDQAAVLPFWHGCFQQALDQNLNGIHEAMTQQAQVQRAVDYADNLVRTSQPSTATTDLAEIQRDKGFIKLFTPFMTFMLKNGNLLSHQYNAMREKKITKGQFFVHVIENFYLPRWSMMLAATALPGDRKDIEDPFWWDMVFDPVKDMFATVPFIRDFVPSEYYKKSAVEVPVVSKLNYAYTSINSMTKGEFDRAAVDSWKLSCWAAGIPWYAAKRSFKQTKEFVTQEEER